MSNNVKNIGDGANESNEELPDMNSTYSDDRSHDDEEEDEEEVEEEEGEVPNEVYDYTKIETVGDLNGKFKLDCMTEEMFEGEYKWKFIKNKMHGCDGFYDLPWNINCQLVLSKTRVLYKVDVEDIFEMIDLFIKYTYDPCEDLELDKSINNQTQMMWGTICPTRKDLFIYKNRQFIAFGRYIFGYNNKYVTIKNYSKKLKFYNPPWDNDCDEYVYSFMIKNHKSNVVEAFGLYR